jgi:hypothetical protein
MWKSGERSAEHMTGAQEQATRYPIGRELSLRCKLNLDANGDHIYGKRVFRPRGLKTLNSSTLADLSLPIGPTGQLQVC